MKKSRFDFMRKKLPFMLAMASVACAAAALEFTVEKNIPYYSEENLAREGDYARNRCLVDVRVPVGVTNFATVVNLHGGGLVKGNKGFAPWPAEAREHDAVAGVAVGYRLLTNATPEQCISDAAAAVAWTVKNISKYGGDPKKVFVTGVSGGGYLTDGGARPEVARAARAEADGSLRHRAVHGPDDEALQRAQGRLQG